MSLLNLASRYYRTVFIATVTIGAVVVYASTSYATRDTNPASKTIEEPDELTKWGMPMDVGREEVEVYCSACHSVRLVAQQGLTRDDWDELFDWMVEEQEMEEMPLEDRKLVLNYLSKYRGTGRKLKIN